MSNIVIDVTDIKEIRALAKKLNESIIINQIQFKKHDSINIFYIETDDVDYNNFINSFKFTNISFSAYKSLGKRFYSTKASKSNKSVYDIKEVVLKNDLDERNLRVHLFKYFRTNKFQSQYIYVITKISILNDSEIYTLGEKNLIDLENKEDLNNYVNHVTAYFLDHLDKYAPVANDKLILSYISASKNSYNKHLRNKMLNKSFDSEIYDGIISPDSIPFNTLYQSWGDVKYISNNQYRISNIVFNNDIDYIDVLTLNYNQTSCTIHFKNSDKSITFIDTNTKDELNKIKRVFSSTNYVYYFEQNKPFFSFDSASFAPKYKKDKKGQPTKKRIDLIRPLKAAEKIDGKFMTFDIETYVSDNEFKILAICFYSSINAKSFYLSDYNSTNELLDDVFNNLFVPDFHNHYLYIHNGSEFDLIFLVKYLLNRDDVKMYPLYKDGKFINLTISYGKEKDEGTKRVKFNYELVIRDSLLLLPSSLAKLAKAFDVDTQKDIYPYSFPSNQNLNYVGEVPDYGYFDNKKVSIKDYSDYKKRFLNQQWSLKDETIYYCMKDCKALYEVINNFAQLIFNKFNVDIFRCPTLPSLAFRIFRTNINIIMNY